MRNVVKVFLLLSMSIFMFSCSNSDSPAKGEGYFVDAPVEGLYYESGVFSGYTDKNGKFEYEIGKKVVFKIGQTVLGEITPSNNFKFYTPSNFEGIDENKLFEMLSLLQTLDDDNNPDNGITINKEQVKKLKFEFGKGLTKITLDNGTEKNLKDFEIAYEHFLNYLAKNDNIQVKPFVIYPNGVSQVAKAEVYNVISQKDDYLSYKGKFAANFPSGIKVGYGSGLVFIGKNADGSLDFYALSDRGPNGDTPKLDNGSATKMFPVPNFSPRIAKIRVKDGKAEVIERFDILNPDGSKVTGLPISPGKTGSTMEYPVSDNFNILNFDDNGLDPEGITVDKYGFIWVCDEYGPFIAKIDPKSHKIVKKYAPGSGLPDVLSKRRENRGLEGIAYYNGKIYSIVQSILNTSNNANFLRIVEFDINSETSKMYAYKIDDDYAKNSDAMVSDIVSIGGGKFLTSERGKLANGYKNRIYLIDLNNAKPIADDNAEKNGLDNSYFVPKKLVVDLRNLNYRYEKAEGLAVIDDKTIAIINDTDFGLTTNVSSLGNVTIKNGLVVDKNGNDVTNNFVLSDNGKEGLQQFYIISLANSLTEFEKSERIEMFHINDHHSHIDGSDTVSFVYDNVTYKAYTGSLAAIYTAMNTLKKEQKNLILHAGDAIVGTLYYTFFKGEVDAKVMNEFKFDAMTVGNHEFDDGDDNLKNFIDKLVGINVLGSNINILTTSSLNGKIKPFYIKTYPDGSKVGIIGVTTSKIPNISSPSKNVQFGDEIESVKKYVAELKNMGINKIVVLSHAGWDVDLKIAQEVAGVDVIIGGHSHENFMSYPEVNITSKFNKYPYVVKNKNNESVCIATAYEHSKVLGNFYVDFDSKGNVLTCEGRAYFVVNGFDNMSKESDLKKYLTANKNILYVKDNDTIVNIIKPYKDQISDIKKTKIGESTEYLGHNRIPGDNYDKNGALPFGSEVAPIVAKAFYDKVKDADASIQNAGGVRIPINAGDITYETAYTLLPFSNTLYKFEMKGSEIKSVLEEALDYALTGKGTGAFPYAYGLRYSINANNAKYQRITELLILDKSTGKFVNVDNNKRYVIVTNNFIAEGKDGYETFGKIFKNEPTRGVNTYFEYAQSFIDWVQALYKDGKKVEKLPRDLHPIKDFVK